MSAGIVAIAVFIAIILAVTSVYAPKETTQQKYRRSGSFASTLTGDVDNASDARLSGFIKKGVNEISVLNRSNITQEKYEEIELFLTKAGNPWKVTVEEFQASKILLGIVGIVVGVIIGIMVGDAAPIPLWGWAALFAFCGYAYPHSKYKSAYNTRGKELRKSLPEAIDLLVITMSSGQNFEPALNIVTPHLEEGILREEFKILNAQISSGMSVERSLRAFAERASSQGTEDFARSVEQAQKLGSDLTDTLMRQSRRAREDYVTELDVKIAKVGNKIMSVLAITVAPAALLCLSAQQLGMITSGLM